MDKKPKYSELLLLNDNIKEEEKRVALAIELDICPKCGSKIIREDYETYIKPINYLFGLIKSYGKIWDYRKVCSNDKKHYEYKTNFNYDMM